MLNKITISAKTKEEALQKALEKLNSNENEVYYYFESEEGGLLKKTKYIVNVVTKYDVKLFIKDYISNLAKNMNTKIECEVNEKEVGLNIVLVGDNNAVLIGKDGKTLLSIQTLLRQALKKEGNFNIKLNIDISNYKAKKERNLTYEVKKIAREVEKTHIDAKLDPMNSYERRIVHTVLVDFPTLITESEGIEPNRYVVIKYKG